MMSEILKTTGIIIIALVAGVNIRSWPFAWHVRLLRPILILLARYVTLQTRLSFKPAKERQLITKRWLEDLSPIGTNPLNYMRPYSSFVGVDEIDYNFHLNNSSYAKLLDIARTNAALGCFPTFIRSGGLFVLGETHFKFLREIPLMGRYEIRVGIASWDDKWLYLISRFVTLPKSKSKSSKSSSEKSSNTPSTSEALKPSVPINAALSALARQPEPDGAILNCISINNFLLRQGRTTVPPALVLACDGHCGPPPADNTSYDDSFTSSEFPSLTPYSIDNPPPHWKHVRAIMDRGGVKAFREFQRKGWQEIPEGERWWEEAFRGEVEVMRKENMAKLEGLRLGMDGSLTIPAQRSKAKL